MQPSSTLTREEALRRIAGYVAPVVAPEPSKPTICEWAEKNFYLAPGSSTESHGRFALPIRLLPHQKAILNYAFHHPMYRFTTVLFSTVKKSGKTAIGGMVARYFAETSGHYAEIYCIANDEEQARGRNFKAALESIENTPNYNKHSKILKDKWEVYNREMKYIPTNSFIRALSNDFRGEAGANPTMSIWSEIWGLVSEKSQSLWSELTPVPTRDSRRFVETYAGFEGESMILQNLWDAGKKYGVQLTHEDMPDWPFDGDIPCYVNEPAGIFAYIDQGLAARRMPWQTERYYQEQAADPSLTEMDFKRFHFNEWTGTETPLFPLQWWKNCHVSNTGRTLRPLDKKLPMVMGIDAGIHNDYTAISIVSREDESEVALRFLEVWKPSKNDVIHFDTTPGESTGLSVVDYITTMCKQYNIVECAFDPSQMQYLAGRLEHMWVVACYEFNQGSDRLNADKAWHDMVRDLKFHYADNFPFMEEAIEGAAKKEGKDEDNKMRIIKKTKASRIDPIIACVMATQRCLYYNLW